VQNRNGGTEINIDKNEVIACAVDGIRSIEVIEQPCDYRWMGRVRASAKEAD